MKKLILCLLFLFIAVSVQAQETVIFLPIIFKDSHMAVNPRLVITDGTTEIDLLGPNSGWKLADPYWNPQIATYKGGGSFVNAQLAEGQRLVHKEYGNVTESIPLSLSGLDQDKAMQTAHEALELLRQAGDYWAEPYEYDDVWIEAKLACNSCLTGYSRIIKGNIPEITNPFGQPFFSSYDKPVMEGITIIFEREPFWRMTKPGTIIGPLYNLIDNPDFELWNFGITDSQPDSWTDIETTHIIGQNSRDQTLPKFGNNDLKIRVSGSTLAGASKGITQVINDTEGGAEYTVIAWVRSEGVSNGVGRILITYASQLELYRESSSHGWTLYTGTITTGASDVVAIHCEILTTAANTDGTFYVDGLMFIKGDYEQEAKDGVLPYMTGSHIVNHTDSNIGGLIEAGDINYIDVWNIPGNVDSLIRLELQNNTTPADDTNPVEIYRTVRIGMRRLNDVFKFDNILDPLGVVDTAASSDSRVQSAINSNFLSMGTKIVSGQDSTKNNQGRFRIYARFYDTKTPTDLQARGQYFVGSDVKTKILDTIEMPVAQQWAMVDLTPRKAMVQDYKFNPDGVSQLGFRVDLKRTSGTDTAYFDYAIAMPTDGGFIEATINPSLRQGNVFVVDNTIINDVKASNIATGWNLLYSTGQTATGFSPFAAIEYKGDIFFNVHHAIFRYRQGAIQNVTPGFTLAAEDDLYGFGILNGLIYMYRTDYSAGDFFLYESADGVSWGLVATVSGLVFPTGNTNNPRFTTFNNRIFFIVSRLGNLDAKVYTYDGTTLSLNFTFPNTPLNRVSEFAIFNNELYITSEDDLYKYNKSLNSWAIEVAAIPQTGAGNSFFALREFNGKLYFGGAGLISWDGITFTEIEASLGTVWTSEIFNDRLYIGGTLTNASIIYTEDGETLVTDNIESQSIRDMLNTLGILFAIDANNDVYIYSNTDVFYTVTDFSGVPFLAPPRTRTNEKRHRYFFSYDRENFINNIDDKALIGIGFVPRYLTLRGKN